MSLSAAPDASVGELLVEARRPLVRLRLDTGRGGCHSRRPPRRVRRPRRAERLGQVDAAPRAPGRAPARRRGTVRLFGGDPAREVQRSWRLGYVPQRPSLAPRPARHRPGDRGRRDASPAGWWRRLRRRPDDEAASTTRSSRSASPTSRACRVSELSGGQQQRAFIARAFAGEPGPAGARRADRRRSTPSRSGASATRSCT